MQYVIVEADGGSVIRTSAGTAEAAARKRYGQGVELRQLPHLPGKPSAWEIWAKLGGSFRLTAWMEAGN